MNKTLPLENMRICMCSALIACGVMCAPSADARAERARIDISSMEAPAAFRQLVLQTDLQILFDPDSVAALLTNPVHGDFAPLDALARMIEGTGLHANLVNERTVALSVATGESGARSSERDLAVRVASEGRNTSGNTQGDADGSASHPGSRPGETSRGGQSSQATDVETIIVTGSNIRGVTQSTSPVRSYGRDSIQRTGAATIDQFARTLPENFASVDGITQGRTPTNTSGGFDQTGSNFAFGSTFNLRGLGPGSTLVLVNGRRLPGAGALGAFADISMIPLSAVESVDVLTDGASAVYGADAVAGVVNIRTRRDFSGGETTLRYGGSTRGGARELFASGAMGVSWRDANAMLVVEHDKQESVNSNERSFVPTFAVPYSIAPEEARDSLFFSGHRSIGSVEMSADVFVSDRETIVNDAASFRGQSAIARSSVEARNRGASVDFQRVLFGSWTGEGEFSYAKLDQSAPIEYLPAVLPSNDSDVSSSVSSFGMRASGDLFSGARLAAKAAVGGEFRRETLSQSASSLQESYDRKVTSLYAELLVQRKGREDSMWRNRIEFSLAGRYDDYYSLGSATTPKVGLLWSPVNGISLRGTYTRSFRVPALPQLNSIVTYRTLNLPNPAAPNGTTATLVSTSTGNPELGPERSTGYSAGIDLNPTSLKSFRFSATYFETEFVDRIAAPPLVGGLVALYSNAASLGPFLDLTPDRAEVDKIFATRTVLDQVGLGPAGVQALFHLHPINIADTRESGIDLSANYAVNSRVGEFLFSCAGTRIFNLDYQVVPTAPEVSPLNKVGTVIDWKIRGALSWTFGGATATVGINHVPSYENNLITPTGKVPSWTTADLVINYSPRTASDEGILSNTNVGLSIRNLTDKDPPFVEVTSVLAGGYGYDPRNASPLGRLLSIQVTKGW